MNGEFETKGTLVNENQIQFRSMTSLMSHRSMLNGAKRSTSSNVSNPSHHIFKSHGARKDGVRNPNSSQNQFNVKRNNFPVNSNNGQQQSYNGEESSLPNDESNQLSGTDGLNQSSNTSSGEAVNKEVDQATPTDALNQNSKTHSGESGAQKGNQVAQKAKAKAIQKGIEVAANAHPLAKAIVSNPIGKKITNKAAEKISSTSGSFTANLKRAVKITSIGLPCVLVIVFMACIIPQIMNVANSGLGSIFLANQLKDPNNANKLLNKELERLSSDEDADSYFGSTSTSSSSSSGKKSTSSSSSSTTTSHTSSTNDNSASYVKATGGFKDKIFYYCQTDYTDPYGYGGYGSIADNGCGPTSLAIAISSILQEEHDPIEVTNYLCGIDGCTAYSGSKFLEMQATAKHYGELYGFDVIITTNEELVKSRLAEGNSLVVTVTNGYFYTNEGSRLSRGGHFFVLTGVADDRNVYIVDPYTPAHTGQTVDIYDLSVNSNNNDNPGGESYYILTKRG